MPKKLGERGLIPAAGFVLLLVAGCAAIPVQETTLRNANGGTVTCKQVGRGVVSYGVGKSIYEKCVDKAHADGYQ
jgi:hypothetical protein